MGKKVCENSTRRGASKTIKGSQRGTRFFHHLPRRHFYGLGPARARFQDSPKDSQDFPIPIPDPFNRLYPRRVSWFALSLSPPPPAKDKVVLSVNAITGVTTYGGYRITRIKGGRVGRGWKTEVEEAKEGRREASKRERPPLTSTPSRCAPVANSSSYLLSRLSPPGSGSSSPPPAPNTRVTTLSTPCANAFIFGH